uniref:zinc finger CCCH domain-containing protein 17-like n=1 Tax=Erigeron canadensis TaxID=72917 RepID=UPI001CB9C3FB|nr:zinc finger CCCH domain-containing protein 17-like [Erigeron canadensis]
MVGGGATSSQLVSPAPAPAISSEEDEILKRNTDCVYFLASPLTCKKGSECEYRHSDVARVNPRDCYYWLNGNCLNPKCAFRHPPLDGLLGSDVSTPMGPPVPAPHQAPYVTPKQGVACIFFQKGFCLKGHLCPFLHGPPNSVNNKPSQSGSANPVSNASKMVPSNPEKPIQEQKFAQQATIQKVTTLPARNGGNGAVDKKVSPPSNFREPPRYKPANVVPTPAIIEQPSSKPNRSGHHGYHVSENDTIRRKDADEYSREPSPGFDVLVDNELEESEYYHEKDGPRRARGQDYDVDRDMYREHRDYDHFNERDGHFDADHVENLERRPFPRSDRENGSDLRHRISKQRRGNDNGVRSVVNRDYDRESQNHVDWIPRRESHHHHRPDQHPDQGTLSSRLRGRIKIPGSNENNRRVERDIDIERKHLSRYSPGRPMSINQSRLRDRIKGPRDMVSDNDAKFAGPRRLSELKSVKSEHQPNNEPSLGKRKYPKTEDDMSFEGPKPLSEILKRKRGISISNSEDHISSINTQDNTPKESDIVSSNKEEHNAVSADLVGVIENNKPEDDNSVNNGQIEVENEDGLIDEDALLDEELEAYDDQRDGEYDYDQMDGEEEDYNLDEGEYIDEEEVEEYEKKENVVYS